jgi:3-hydroxyacyl-CoA dehydrogenase
VDAGGDGHVRTIGVVGTGVIGAGWAVRALARGHDVVAWDPAPGAAERLRSAVAVSSTNSTSLAAPSMSLSTFHCRKSTETSMR